MHIRLFIIIFELDFLFGFNLLNLNATSFHPENSNAGAQNKTHNLGRPQHYQQIDKLPQIKVMDSKHNEINTTNNSYTYSWSKWGKWSKCSRICGGGVQIRKRRCVERLSLQKKTLSFESAAFENGELKACVGLYKRFRICNDKECPSASEEKEHLDQCSYYNDMLFNGKKFMWLPYLKGK